MIWKMTKLLEIEEIMLCKLVLLKIPKQPRNWRLYPGGGGKTFWYTHFGGPKTLFSYINLQVTDSVGGEPCKFFHLRGNAPRAPCRYVPVPKSSSFNGILTLCLYIP